MNVLVFSMWIEAAECTYIFIHKYVIIRRDLLIWFPWSETGWFHNSYCRRESQGNHLSFNQNIWEPHNKKDQWCSPNWRLKVWSPVECHSCKSRLKKPDVTGQWQQLSHLPSTEQESNDHTFTFYPSCTFYSIETPASGWHWLHSALRVSFPTQFWPQVDYVEKHPHRCTLKNVLPIFLCVLK